MAERREELKSLLRVKEESENAGLKLNIQKTKVMASGPIISWQIDGGTKMETMADFIFLGSEITDDGDFRHEMKRHLLLRRKAVTYLGSILKSRVLHFRLLLTMMATPFLLKDIAHSSRYNGPLS